MRDHAAVQPYWTERERGGVCDHEDDERHLK